MISERWHTIHRVGSHNPVGSRHFGIWPSVLAASVEIAALRYARRIGSSLRVIRATGFADEGGVFNALDKSGAVAFQFEVWRGVVNPNERRLKEGV